MSEIKDTRNWKCFIGLHQWSINIFCNDDFNSIDDAMHYRYATELECLKCGKIKIKIAYKKELI